MVAGLADRKNTRPPASITSRFRSLTKAPPPEAMTCRSPAHRSAMTRLSRYRKAGSPSSAKMRWIGLPARSTITSSASTSVHPGSSRVAATRDRDSARARPTLVLPEAMKPTSMMLRGDVSIRFCAAVSPAGASGACVSRGWCRCRSTAPAGRWSWWRERRR